VTREEAHFVSAQALYSQTFILQNQFLEDRVNKLENDFREKFDGISILVDNLESSLKQKIDQLQPEDLHNRFTLLEEYSLIQKYKEELDSIDEDSQACEEASRWLDKNRNHLINYAFKHIFSKNYQLKQFTGIHVDKETAQLFCQDLDSYFRWIGHYLHMATPPKEIPSGVIRLCLPKEMYIEVFKIIRDDKLSTTSGLSERAVIMLTSSINRFLIKRKLELDAPRL
jgi:hypothetical protein